MKTEKFWRNVRGNGTSWLVGMALCTGFASWAVEAISITATPRYPWNGRVDLRFVISGTSGMKYDTSFTAKDLVGNTNLTMKTIYKADGTVANAAKEQLQPGTYNWEWDTEVDFQSPFILERVQIEGNVSMSAFPYKVKFNANGGSGTMSEEPFMYGMAKTLTANSFTRIGRSSGMDR